MNIKLNSNNVLGLQKGTKFSYNPRFVLESLHLYLTPITDDRLLEKEKTRLFGNDFSLWQEGDSFLFDPLDNTLKYSCFVMPEKNKIISNTSWIFHSEGTQGLITLEKSSNSFEIKSMTYRFYSLENDMLICFNDDFLTSTEGLKEIEIAENLSIVFSEYGYCAWKLKKPTLYLLEDLSSNPQESNSPTEFEKFCFSEALSIIEDENINKMDDSTNLEPLEKISNLYNKIIQSNLDKDVSLDVISNWLKRVAANFYSTEQINTLMSR